MQNKRKIIYLISFIFSLSIALMSYINSSFISSFLNEKFVGTIYALGSITSIIALLVVNKIFRKIGGYRFLLLTTILNALSILFLAFADNALKAGVFFVFGFTFNILIFFCLDELLKIFSKDKAMGSIRGTYLALVNCSWVIAQLSLGTVLGGFSFKIIYLTSFVTMTTAFIVSYLYLRNMTEPSYDNVNTTKYIGEFLKNKNLFRGYVLNFLLQFFYSWMVIYTPIYLSLHLGFTWKEIGFIFAIMLIPFIIIPMPLGKYSDKIGERKMLMYGFTIISISTFSIFFIQTHILLLWALILFFTRVGAATIETMTDVYFLKHIKPENEEFLRVYRTAAPVAYIIGPLSAFFVFLFIPSFNFIYLILGAIMLSGVYISSTIKKRDN
ncbi:MAG: MFS transporter [Candidatus Parcubacteria bacterium]|nr:MFS transporter [Candidatus Parcubacteria bacterium]